MHKTWRRISAFSSGIRWITACSLLLAQYVWADHLIEHVSHDAVEICALCVHSERNDDQVITETFFETRNIFTAGFSNTEYAALISQTVNPHYHSRASP